ncbi:SON DNA binding protein, partial [Chelydra serpentina]
CVCVCVCAAISARSRAAPPAAAVTRRLCLSRTEGSAGPGAAARPEPYGGAPTGCGGPGPGRRRPARAPGGRGPGPPARAEVSGVGRAGLPRAGGPATEPPPRAHRRRRSRGSPRPGRARLQARWGKRVGAAFHPVGGRGRAAPSPPAPCVDGWGRGRTRCSNMAAGAHPPPQAPTGGGERPRLSPLPPLARGCALWFPVGAERLIDVPSCLWFHRGRPMAGGHKGNASAGRGGWPVASCSGALWGSGGPALRMEGESSRGAVMATNIEQIFRSFVVSKFREIQEEQEQQQQLGGGKVEGQQNGETISAEQANTSDDTVTGAGSLQNDQIVQKIDEVLSGALDTELQCKSGVEEDSVKNPCTKRGPTDEVEDEIPRKKSKKNKKHKSKKKKKKKKKKRKKEKKHKKQPKESKLSAQYGEHADLQPASHSKTEKLGSKLITQHEGHADSDLAGQMQPEELGTKLSTEYMGHSIKRLAPHLLSDSESSVEKLGSEKTDLALTDTHSTFNSETSKLDIQEENTSTMKIQEQANVKLLANKTHESIYHIAINMNAKDGPLPAKDTENGSVSTNRTGVAGKSETEKDLEATPASEITEELKDSEATLKLMGMVEVKELETALESEAMAKMKCSEAILKSLTMASSEGLDAPIESVAIAEVKATLESVAVTNDLVVTPTSVVVMEMKAFEETAESVVMTDMKGLEATLETVDVAEAKSLQRGLEFVTVPDDLVATSKSVAKAEVNGLEATPKSASMVEVKGSEAALEPVAMQEAKDLERTLESVTLGKGSETTLEPVVNAKDLEAALKPVVEMKDLELTPESLHMEEVKGAEGALESVAIAIDLEGTLKPAPVAEAHDSDAALLSPQMEDMKDSKGFLESVAMAKGPETILDAVGVAKALETILEPAGVAEVKDL